MPASSFGLAIFVAQGIGLALLLAAIFAPSYHHESLVLPGGANALFELSLFSVKVFSHCTPILLNLFRFRGPVMESSMCRNFVDSLNQRSLREVTDTLCG